MFSETKAISTSSPRRLGSSATSSDRYKVTIVTLPLATPCSGYLPAQQLHRTSLIAAQGAIFGEVVRDRAAYTEWCPVFLARTSLDLVNFYCIEQTNA